MRRSEDLQCSSALAISAPNAEPMSTSVLGTHWDLSLSDWCDRSTRRALWDPLGCVYLRGSCTRFVPTRLLCVKHHYLGGQLSDFSGRGGVLHRDCYKLSCVVMAGRSAGLRRCRARSGPIDPQCDCRVKFRSEGTDATSGSPGIFAVRAL